jgi:hypothetical protein
MGDGVFHILNELENRQPGRQYSLTQPQFSLPPRPVPARDRYRAPRDFVRDVPDHPQAYEYEEQQDIPYDSFGESTLALSR